MHYSRDGKIALLSLDDGKANVVGHELIAFCNDSLDRAENEGAGAIVIRGRSGMFSGGFDLQEFKQGADGGLSMVLGGLSLLVRLYGFPAPVVAACTGHAVAMGAFLLLAADTRLGVRGDFRITLPETRISMEVPQILQALTQSRLSPRYLTRAIVQSEIFDPQSAVEAGFLDGVVEPEKLDGATMAAAAELAELPGQYYAANKRFVRQAALDAMQAELDRFRGAA